MGLDHDLLTDEDEGEEREGADEKIVEKGDANPPPSYFFLRFVIVLELNDHFSFGDV